MNQSDPFNSPKNTTSIAVHAIHMTFGVALIILRLPSLFLLIAILFFYHYLIYPLVLINNNSKLILSHLKRISSLLIDLTFFRMILFVLGFYHIKSNKNFFSSPSSFFITAPPMTRSGYILLCNRKSPIDILYLACFYSPIFVKVFYKDEKVLLSPLSLYQTFKLAFSLSFQLPEEQSNSTMQKLSPMKVIEDSFNEWNGPLALFYEGASVNQDCIIEPQSALLQETLNVKVKYCRQPVVISFHYPDKSKNNHIVVRLLLTSEYTNQSNFSPLTHDDQFIQFSSHQCVANSQYKLHSQVQDTENDYKQFLYTRDIDVHKIEASWKDYKNLLDGNNQKKIN